jgi:hypothetical protein
MEQEISNTFVSKSRFDLNTIIIKEMTLFENCFIFILLRFRIILQRNIFIRDGRTHFKTRKFCSFFLSHKFANRSFLFWPLEWNCVYYSYYITLRVPVVQEGRRNTICFMYMIKTCAFLWNFRENVNVLKNSLLKMSNSIFFDWKLTKY